MAMDRRTFLGTIAAAGILSSRLHSAVSDRKLNNIGLQLYTVREALKNDLAGTLAKVAQIGYREIESAGLFGHTPKDVRGMLDDKGLTAPSSHVPYSTLGEDWPRARWMTPRFSARVLSFAHRRTMPSSNSRMAGSELPRRSTVREQPARKPASSSRTTITPRNSQKVEAGCRTTSY